MYSYIPYAEKKFVAAFVKLHMAAATGFPVAGSFLLSHFPFWQKYPKIEFPLCAKLSVRREYIPGIHI